MSHPQSKGGDLRVDRTEGEILQDLIKKGESCGGNFAKLAMYANRLKAELDLRDKVIEQACKATDLRLTTIGQMPIGCPDTRHRDADDKVFAGCGALGRTFLAGEIADYPELFAHLSGRGE